MGTIVTAAVLIAIVTLIIAGLIKDKRNGKSSCGCGCESCAMREKCHSSAENTE